jgi:hypothetical protein
MSYRIAGIDVHKKMLAVVVSDVEIESEYQFERRMFGSSGTMMNARRVVCELMGQTLGVATRRLTGWQRSFDGRWSQWLDCVPGAGPSGDTRSRRCFLWFWLRR